MQVSAGSLTKRQHRPARGQRPHPPHIPYLLSGASAAMIRPLSAGTGGSAQPSTRCARQSVRRGGRAVECT